MLKNSLGLGSVRAPRRRCDYSLSGHLEEKYVFDEAKPECIIELDEFVGEHRDCDLVVLCRAKQCVLRLTSRQRRMSHSAITRSGSITTKSSSPNRKCPNEFRNYHYHCLDECQMKLLENFGTSFTRSRRHIDRSEKERSGTRTVIDSRVPVCQPE